MSTNTKRISTGVVIFAMLAIFTALLLAAYFLYGRQFTEQDYTTDVSIPTQTGTITFAPTGTLPPPSTQSAQQPTAVPPTATDAPVIATIAPAQPTATLPDETINIYMVALGDNSASGPATGCGDSLVPVQRTVAGQPSIEARIAAALVELFTPADQTFAGTVYYNALYQSELAVNSVTFDAGLAIVDLTGNVLVTDDCDDSRVAGQIEQTIVQFAEVSAAQVTLNGVPLDVALAAD